MPKSARIGGPAPRALATLTRVGVERRKAELVMSAGRSESVKRRANSEPQRGRPTRHANELGIEAKRLGIRNECSHDDPGDELNSSAEDGRSNINVLMACSFCLSRSSRVGRAG